MKRIAVGQILQETNTLNPIPTKQSDFDVYGFATGPDIMANYGDVGELAGFQSLPDVLDQEVKWTGLVRAVAWSNGPLEPGLLANLTTSTIKPFETETFDGILLSLHGAQSSEDDPDVSGHVLEAVRKTVGPNVPVVATLDLHANVTKRMVQNADVLVGYHTFPHIDHVSCGQRAARALGRLIMSGERPNILAWKIPMVVASEGRTTDRGIQVDLWNRIVAAEKRDDVFSMGLYMVQPWFDEPELGWTFYQAFSGDRAPMDHMEIAESCWDTRYHRETPFVAPGDLLDAAMAIEGGPVAVSESHDATNSGAPGDSTLLLRALVAGDIPHGGALTFCVDPLSVAMCHQTGAGQQVDLQIGGHVDPYSDPISVSSKIERIGSLTYHLTGHGGHNLPVDMGRMAVVRIRDVTVVLVEATGPGSSPQLYEAAGLDPRSFKIVIAKSPEGFRVDYEPFSAGILYCGAAGCATPFLDTVSFTNVSKPVFPVEDLQVMNDAGWAGDMTGHTS
ncbi:MAG: M81 family metallopeptidase [Candidatus Latescibacteria bacterium]|nr:M81 family metallopeptidase [Candidatus Latescibacterota bacterium]